MSNLTGNSRISCKFQYNGTIRRLICDASAYSRGDVAKEKYSQFVQEVRNAFAISPVWKIEFRYIDNEGDIITVSDWEDITDALTSQQCKKMEVIAKQAIESTNVKALDTSNHETFPIESVNGTQNSSNAASTISFSPTIKGKASEQDVKTGGEKMEGGYNAGASTQASHTQPPESITSELTAEQARTQVHDPEAPARLKSVDISSVIDDLKEKLFKSFDTKSIAEDLTGRLWGMLQKHGLPLDSAARMLAAATEPEAGVSASEIRSQLTIDTELANESGSSNCGNDIVTHTGVYCDGPDCDKVIQGPRYKCVSGCYNFDLCENCEAKNVRTDKHTPDHTLLKIKRPKSVPIDAFIVPKSRRLSSTTPLIATVHKFCFCDVCDKAIVATRWKCGMCINFDVCSDCLSKIDRKHVSHADDHCFIRICKPIQKFVSESVPLLPPFYDGSMTYATVERKSAAENSITTKPALESSTAFPNVQVTPPSLKNMRRTSRIASEMFSPTTAPTPPTDASDNIYKASFVDDVSYPDGTLVRPGTELEKIWSFTNSGESDWPEDVQLIRVGGHKSVFVDPVQNPVSPAKAGETVNVGVKVRIPSIEGRYITYFRLVTSDGRRFGHRVWLDLMVDDDADNQDEVLATSSMIFPKLKFGNEMVERQSERGTISVPPSARSNSRAPSVMTEDPFSDANTAMSLPGDISEDLQSIADTKTTSTLSRRSSFTGSDNGSDFVVVDGEQDEDAVIEMEYQQDEEVIDEPDETGECMVVDAVSVVSGNSAFENEEESNEHHSMYFNAETSQETAEPQDVNEETSSGKDVQEHFMPGGFRSVGPSTPERPIVQPAMPESPSAFELKMTALAEMGFTDREFNSELLQVHDGDLEGVISDLLGNTVR